MKQHVAIRLPYRMGHIAVTHAAAIDVQILLVGAGAIVGRLRDPAMQAHPGSAVVHAQHIARKVFAQRLVQTQLRQQVTLAFPTPRRLAVVGDAQFHIRPRQCQSAQPVFDMGKLCTFGAQEFAPRRHVVKQIAHFHRGALRMRLRHHFAKAAAIDAQLRAMLRIACA